MLEETKSNPNIEEEQKQTSMQSKSSIPGPVKLVVMGNHQILTDQIKDRDQIDEDIKQHFEMEDTPPKVDQELDNAEVRQKMWSVSKLGSINIVNKNIKNQPLRSKKILRVHSMQIKLNNEALDQQPLEGRNNTGHKCQVYKDIIVPPSVQKMINISEHSSENANSSQKIQNSNDSHQIYRLIDQSNELSLQRDISLNVSISLSLKKNYYNLNYKISSDPIKQSQKLQFDQNVIYGTAEDYFQDCLNTKFKKKSQQDAFSLSKSEFKSDKQISNEAIKSSNSSSENQQSLNDCMDVNATENLFQSQLSESQQVQIDQQLEQISEQNENLSNESINSDPQNVSQLIREPAISDVEDQNFEDIDPSWDFPDEFSTYEDSEIANDMKKRKRKMQRNQFTASRNKTLRK